MLTFDLYRVSVYRDGGSGLVLPQKSDEAPEGAEIVALSNVEEVIEREEGSFRIGNVTVTMLGLPRDYFNDSTDPNRPFVMVLKDDDEVVFHGAVDPGTVTYDRRTRYTKFAVLSWESMLARVGNVPARSVYEADVIEFKEMGYPSAYVSIPYDPEILTTDLRGSVVVFENDYGEVRAVVKQVGVFIDDKILLWFDLPAPTEVYRWDDSDFLQDEFLDLYEAVVFYNGEEVLETYFPPNDTYEDDDGNQLPLFNATSGQPSPGVYLEALDANGDTLASFNPRFIYYQFPDTPPWDAGTWVILPASVVTQFQAAQEIRLVSTPARSKPSKMRLLGKELYGYAPSLFSQNFGLLSTMEAMLQLGQDNLPDEGEGKPLGILPNLLWNFEYEGSFGSFTMARYIELADKPIEALREMQLLGRLFVRFVPIEVSGIARFNVRFTARAEVGGESVVIPSETGFGVISWEEQTTEERVKAVVVRPNRDYFKRKDENAEWVGVWFEQDMGGGVLLTPDEIHDMRPDLLTYMGVPEGEGVIEIEVPMAPRFEAEYAFRGGGAPVWNDLDLKAVARYYYEHFTAMPYRFTAQVAQRRPDWLGKIITFNEGVSSPIQEKAYITKRSYSLRHNEARTSVEGYIIPPSWTPPPVPDPGGWNPGPVVVYDSDDDGVEDVLLTFERVRAPLGTNALAITWRRRELAGDWPPGDLPPEVEEYVIEDPDVPVGVYVYEVYVRDTVTDQVEVITFTVAVLAPEPSYTGIVPDEGTGGFTHRQILSKISYGY